MTPGEVMKLIRDKGIQVVDLKFVDLPGMWQHFSASAPEFIDSIGLRPHPYEFAMYFDV
jgi:glutamine synthetase